MAQSFLLKDMSGRSVANVVDLAHVLGHFGTYDNDPDDQFGQSVAEWAPDASPGDQFELGDDNAILIAIR